MNINKVVEIINQKGIGAVIQNITKGSITKTGITIGTGTVRPTIYPDQFTADDFTDEEIADKVIELYEKNKAPEFNIEQITSEEYIKNNLFLSARRPIDDDAFTKTFLDIQLVLRVRVDENSSFKVTKAASKQFGIDESAFDEAIKNMNFNFNPMGSIIGQILETEEVPECGMYVVNTEDSIFGATALYDKIFLKSISDLLNSDLVIIPSSTHELIVLKRDEKVNVFEMNEMVKEVNNTQVIPEEQLADHVYIYEKETGIIKY